MAARHDRAKQILHLLLQKGSGSIEDLSVAVGASPASVRRDLIHLEERGLVHRTHGGAEVAGKLNYQPFRLNAAYPLREERFADVKRRIAMAAAELAEKNDTIAISPGTTTTQLARSLRHREDLHIVTTAVNIGMELSNLPGLSVTLTGGALRWPGSFSMVGATAFDSIQRLFFDKLFLGVCGVHPEYGITVIESDEALILSKMVRHSKQVIALGDSSKLGVVCPVRVCATEDVDAIVTDEGANPAVIEALRERRIRVILA